ncbi:MAG: hypothetical protein HZA54_17760 [Planctomycetes bacterium]|nr:hypothetical protein [Planctomycetota bacterium]
MRRAAAPAALTAATCALLLFARVGSAPAGAAPPGPRLDQLQVVGTHNSYHVAPDAVAARLIQAAAPAEAPAIEYTHRPIREQLERLGMRQLEFDLYLDPAGGRYARPMALRRAARAGADVPPHDPEQRLRAPGIKILHSPDFDFRTTALTLHDALAEVRAWSAAHPRHVPVFLLLEPKFESYWPLTRPPAWDGAALATLEAEVLAVLPRDRLLTPDDVRGTAPTLRAAVEGRGWPGLEAARGKIVLLLDDEGAARAAYLAASATLAGRLCFVTVARDHPAAAWIKRNDPVAAFDEIRALVAAGFLVRTRADEATREARAGDGARRERAFASGAQLVSTDFPEADRRWSDYAVRLPGGVAARANPVTWPTGSGDRDLDGE